MEYMISQSNLNDLKEEDSYDHYIFKSLHQDPSQHEYDYLDELLKDDKYIQKSEKVNESIKIDDIIENILDEMEHLIPVRTTSLNEVIGYVHQYFTIPK